MAGTREELAFAERIEAIADRVYRNSPRNSDPHRYHEEKSEIRGDLRALAYELRTGQKLVERA